MYKISCNRKWVQLENYHVPDPKTYEINKDTETVLTFWGEKLYWMEKKVISQSNQGKHQSRKLSGYALEPVSKKPANIRNKLSMDDQYSNSADVDDLNCYIFVTVSHRTVVKAVVYCLNRVNQCNFMLNYYTRYSPIVMKLVAKLWEKVWISES